MKSKRHFSFYILMGFLLWLGNMNANNGSIAYIYPISNIKIDGNLDDWPETVKRNAMLNVHYGAGLDGPEDGLAFWRGGYDAQAGELYIGVTMNDDDYVKTPNDSHYATHDFHVIYLDLLHSPEGSGVIGFEVDEDHRKIVEQEGLHFYPQVKNANFDQVELAIVRINNTVTYEWKIKIPGVMVAGRVIGFDYAVFDKDTKEDNVMITWGRTEGNKFLNSNLIGDLVLMEVDNRICKVEGNLKLESKNGAKKNWPHTVKFSNTTRPNEFFQTSIDSLGKYSLQLPKGEYEITIPPSYQMNNWFDIDLIQGADKVTNITISDQEELVVETIIAALVPKPDLIPKKGLLHTPFNSNSANQVDAFVEAYQTYYDIPAVSIAVIQDSKVAYHKSYGVENNISQKPIRAKAVFEAASITKLVFAYLINRLVQRGDFDLDKPLYKTLPFPELEKYPEYKLMTGRHVLTHMSGLPNWGTYLISTPGTTLGYSGQGFEYLKKILAKGNFEELPRIIQTYLDKEILKPLGMKNTYFMCHDDLTNLKVAGHQNGVPTIYDCPDEPGMAYSMHTEAKDFALFALALLHRTGLTEKQATEMFRFHTLDKKDNWMNGYQAGYGLGVALRDSPYGLVFGHSGNNGDFRCNFEIYDELKSGYIMFTNSNTGGPLLFDLRKFLVEGNEVKD